MNARIFPLLIIILALFSLTGCNKNLKSYETPLALYSESTLVTYENKKYNYTIGYPDIFDKNEKAPNGIQLSNDESLLIIWAKANKDDISLQESYENALSQYNGTSDGGIYRTCYDFHFVHSDTENGYYFGMIHKGNIYSFVMTYPKDKEDEFEGYRKKMIKSYLVLE